MIIRKLHWLQNLYKRLVLEIWTDVSGIYTTDHVSHPASPIPEISFSEASEMANFGAVLHPSTLVPAFRHQIPVFVGSSKSTELVVQRDSSTGAGSCSAMSAGLRYLKPWIYATQRQYVPATYGFLAKVFEIVLAKHKISVDPHHYLEISVSLTLDQNQIPLVVLLNYLKPLALSEELCSVDIEHDPMPCCSYW